MWCSSRHFVARDALFLVVLFRGWLQISCDIDRNTPTTVGLRVLLGDKFPLHSRNFTNGIGGGGTGSILTSGLCTVRRPSAKLHGTPIADSIISMSQRTLYSRRRTARALDTPSDAPMKHFCTAVTHSMPNAESAHGIHSVQSVIWY